VVLITLIAVLIPPLSYVAVFGEGSQPEQARRVLSLFVPVLAAAITTMLPLLFQRK
jgi:hypothetical protein